MVCGPDSHFVPNFFPSPHFPRMSPPSHVGRSEGRPYSVTNLTVLLPFTGSLPVFLFWPPFPRIEPLTWGLGGAHPTMPFEFLRLVDVPKLSVYLRTDWVLWRRLMSGAFDIFFFALVRAKFCVSFYDGTTSPPLFIDDLQRWTSSWKA